MIPLYLMFTPPGQWAFLSLGQVMAVVIGVGVGFIGVNWWRTRGSQRRLKSAKSGVDHARYRVACDAEPVFYDRRLRLVEDRPDHQGLLLSPARTPIDFEAYNRMFGFF